MYILVEFTDEKNVAVIPDNWLEGTSCAVWPTNLSPGKLMKAVKDKMEPKDSWPAFPIRELYKNESFLEVRQKLRKAEEQSDLATTDAEQVDPDDMVRKSKRPKRPTCISSSEEDEACSSSAKVPLKPARTTPQEKASPPKVPVRPTPLLPRQGSFGLIKKLEVANQHPTTDQARFEARLFGMLEKMQARQEDVVKKIDMLSKTVLSMKISPTTSVETVVPDTLKFPLTSIEEVEEINRKLLDDNLMQRTINYLSAIGGRGIREAIRRAMGHVLHNHTATLYNWNGQKGKHPFGNQKLCSAIQTAILRTQTGSVVDYECHVKEWLRTASDRDGGRKKRIRKLSPCTTENQSEGSSALANKDS